MDDNFKIVKDNEKINTKNMEFGLKSAGQKFAGQKFTGKNSGLGASHPETL